MPRPSDVEKRLRRALASNVRRVREGGALSLHDAAERAGIHWRHWQKVEAGEANATLNTIAKIAAALDVDPLDLLEHVVGAADDTAELAKASESRAAAVPAPRPSPETRSASANLPPDAATPPDGNGTEVPAATDPRGAQ